MASPPKIYKQSKSPLLNSTNTATVGDIWIDLNDVPATIKTLVTATGVTAYWTLKKSEILGSEISLSGQTPKSIESDDSILFKIGGRNNFKISSATIPGGSTRPGELLPSGIDSVTSNINWNELAVANPTGDVDVTPVPYDSYSRNIVTNFSDESGGGFAFKVGEEKLMTLRPFRSPAISNRLPAPLEGQVVIGSPTQLGYLDMSLFNNANSAKLIVNGNLHIGNSTFSNFMSFGGTYSDDAAAAGHTYIGERIYESPEKSELIIFKGNDPTISGYDTGPDRIRYIAGNHVFQTYLTNVQGTFSEIATTSSAVTRMSISSQGDVSIAGNTYLTGLATVTALANLYVASDGRLYKSDSVDFAFESSLSTSGYQKLPSGMIIQWGLLVIPQNGAANATFPIAFNAVFGVVLTSNSGTNTGANSSNYKAVAWVSNTGFQGQSAEGTRGNFWIAFGR